MPSGKRASMREGPLAELFRKTDRKPDATEEPEAPEAPSGAPGGQSDEPRRGPAPASSAATAAERLRTVFSPDIPDNMMELRPRYGREQPRLAVEPDPVRKPVLRVVGVGGAGVNAVNRMIEAEVEGVEFIAVNTDVQSLQQCSAHVTVAIGEQSTRGLGSGADPTLGRSAAMEEYDQIKALLKGSDMVFVAAGEGGGTGTGAAPVVARIANEVGALTVGIVSKPFAFEGARRSAQAEEGIEELASHVDTLIVVPNTRLLSVLDREAAIVDAFRVADDVLRQGVQGISDLITLPGLINLDFADVRTVMSSAGQALLGIGMGTGENRAVDAARRAVESPLLETSVDGARSILLSITGGGDLSLWEVNEAAKAVAEAAHPEANIIFGAMVDPKVVDEAWVTVIATGYGDRGASAGEPGGWREAARQVDREPRVTRASRPSRSGGELDDLQIPEFLPRTPRR